MARYIDADLIPYVESENGVLDDFSYRYDINEIPTVDVVPKSEVEKLKAKIDKLKRDRYQILPDGRLELLPRTDIDKIKTEVAREIFEEIEQLFPFSTIPNNCAIVSIDKIAELKKKYTEEKKDEN